MTQTPDRAGQEEPGDSKSSGDIEIVPVTDRKGIAAFIDVPFDVFRNDSNWIPPLNIERIQHFDRKKNPYFDHAEAAMWVARRNGKTVGRISAQVCQLHLATHNDSAGQFGFCDAIDDENVFAALLSTAERWVADKGMSRIRGPFNFSINDEMGLLIDGFDTPPYMMMGHALPYYAGHIETQGYAKAVDVFAYEATSHAGMPRSALSMIRKAKETGNLEIRPLNKSNLKEDLAIILEIFNDAWSDNWGFVPMTDREIEALGANLKLLVKGEYIAIASYKGEPAAMAVTLPNINEWVADFGGRLFPFNVFKLLWRLYARPPSSVRLPLMGVKKEFQSGAIGAALALGVIDTVRTYHLKRGTDMAELSWVLEQNDAMRRMIEMATGKAYKTYRIYEKSL